MTLHRRRRCGECGKPLGSTVGLCYECGGEDPSPSRRERLADAENWKLLGGIPWKKVKRAHGYKEGDN